MPKFSKKKVDEWKSGDLVEFGNGYGVVLDHNKVLLISVPRLSSGTRYSVTLMEIPSYLRRCFDENKIPFTLRLCFTVAKIVSWGRAKTVLMDEPD